MSLLEKWREFAYNNQMDEQQAQAFWGNYFNQEMEIYKQILADPDTVVTGTVKELAEKFGVELSMMVGFLDGINDSLVEANPIETMDEDTVVNLGYDKEKLYYNMVGARADWLYELPEWNTLLSEERRKELYKEQKSSTTVVKPKKVGR
ncbi:MAG: SEC-C domain-containing protein, partial [Lachnospiraceae bacterium]|nr:SEC-C domain-containing protein [Lachnospiraceae bacterium]